MGALEYIAQTEVLGVQSAQGIPTSNNPVYYTDDKRRTQEGTFSIHEVYHPRRPLRSKCGSPRTEEKINSSVLRRKTSDQIFIALRDTSVYN